MNKLFTSIAVASLSLTMAVGVGVAVGTSKSKAQRVNADEANYSVIGFESSEGFTATSTYNRTLTQGPTGSQWTFHYGTTSTSSKITGNQSAALRLYTSNNYGYLKSNYTFADVTKVEFKAKAGTSGSAKILLNVDYSTNGSSWSSMLQTSATGSAFSKKQLGTSATTYTAYIPSASSGDNSVYLRFAIDSTSTKPSSGNAQLTIDDVKVYYYTSAVTTYTVSFNANGGTGSMSNVTANQGTYTLPSNGFTAPQGKTFAGWKANNAGGVLFADGTYDLQSNVEMFAIWYTASSAASPYTVADARDVIDLFGGTHVPNAYVLGYVSQIDEISTEHGNATYWVSDDGTKTNQFEIYRGKGLNGASFTSENDIQIGARVISLGSIYKYNTTYEFASGSKQTSYSNVSSISVNTAPSKISYGEGESFIPSGLVIQITFADSNTRLLTYSSGTSSLFTFAPTTSDVLSSSDDSVQITVYGKTTTQSITVSGRAVTSVALNGDMTNKTYLKGANWDYSGLYLTVNYSTGDPTTVQLSTLVEGTDFTSDPSTANSLSVTSVSIEGSYHDKSFSKTVTSITVVESVTFVAGTDIGVSDGQNADTVSKNGVSMHCTSMNDVEAAGYRFYKDSVLTFSANGATIKSVVFTGVEGYSISNLTAGTGTYVCEDETGTWVGSASSVSFTAGAQTRATQVVVSTIEAVIPEYVTYTVEDSWELVTDASVLSSGDQIIITNKASTKGNLAYESGNNVSSTAVTVSGTKLTSIGSAVPLTLSTAGTDTFYINDGTYYWYAASSSGNQMKGKAAKDSENGSWKFEYDSTNSCMTIVADGSSNRNVMQFNNASDQQKFSCYATASQTALQVYRNAGGTQKVLIENDLKAIMQSVSETFQCDRSGATFDDDGWDDVGELFTQAIITKYHLDIANASASGNDVEQFLADYDYIVIKYGASKDFLGRNPSAQGLVNHSIFNSVGTEVTTAIIVVVALTSVTAIGAIFFIKRRKYN